jgi:hypothetical protein
MAGKFAGIVTAPRAGHDHSSWLEAAALCQPFEYRRWPTQIPTIGVTLIVRFPFRRLVYIVSHKSLIVQ